MKNFKIAEIIKDANYNVTSVDLDTREGSQSVMTGAELIQSTESIHATATISGGESRHSNTPALYAILDIPSSAVVGGHDIEVYAEIEYPREAVSDDDYDDIKRIDPNDPTEEDIDLLDAYDLDVNDIDEVRRVSDVDAELSGELWSNIISAVEEIVPYLSRPLVVTRDATEDSEIFDPRENPVEPETNKILDVDFEIRID